MVISILFNYLILFFHEIGHILASFKEGLGTKEAHIGIPISRKTSIEIQIGRRTLYLNPLFIGMATVPEVNFTNFREHGYNLNNFLARAARVASAGPAFSAFLGFILVGLSGALSVRNQILYLSCATLIACGAFRKFYNFIIVASIAYFGYRWFHYGIQDMFLGFFANLINIVESSNKAEACGKVSLYLAVWNSFPLSMTDGGRHFLYTLGRKTSETIFKKWQNISITILIIVFLRDLLRIIFYVIE